MNAVNGLLLVDKEQGMTSHDVVGLARRVLNTKAVGHAGTLDPMATGLLVLGVGEGTKLLGYVGGDGKCYRGIIALGSLTSTWDADGDVVERRAVPQLTLDMVREAAQPFVGTFMQRPPAVSAIKQDGEPLYKKVRRGEAVTAPLREVTVFELTVHEVRESLIEFTVVASSGFYVRSLANDLAVALGTVGHLTYLRRERSGTFDVKDAIATRELRESTLGNALACEHVRRAVLPLAQSLRRVLPHAVLDDIGSQHARHGRGIAIEHVVSASNPELDAGSLGLFDPEGTPLAIAHMNEGVLRVRRGFVV